MKSLVASSVAPGVSSASVNKIYNVRLQPKEITFTVIYSLIFNGQAPQLTTSNTQSGLSTEKLNEGLKSGLNQCPTLQATEITTTPIEEAPAEGKLRLII